MLAELGRNCLKVVIGCVLLLASLSVYARDGKPPHILILNSYHNGYVWSDNIMNGIESTLSQVYSDAQLHIEYLDTKNEKSPAYLNFLFNAFKEKYQNAELDLVIAADDNAIQFGLDYYDALFAGIPFVFCGANQPVLSRYSNNPNITGVLEHSDLQATLQLALTLQPELQQVYVISDNTTTGANMQAQLQQARQNLDRPLEFIVFEDQPLSQLSQRVANLPENSIILLLAYMRDSSGQLYRPKRTAEILADAANVPIYSVWDFYFGHGIIGGVITGGFSQGEAAAQLALEILQGTEPAQLPVKPVGGSQILLDDKQLKRFLLSRADAPSDAIIKNISYLRQKNVLMLFSYSANNSWNREILTGIEQTFAESTFDMNVFIEYMDTKRYADKGYLNSLYKIYQMKYARQSLDLVMVADDNAYDFAVTNRHHLFPDTPIVFSGLNYVEDPDTLSQQKIAGVLEPYDILGTIELGLQLFPETKNIFAINDSTATGIKNNIRLENILSQLPKGISVTRSGLPSMEELIETVATLPNDTLILLMSFTQDKHNSQFSYEKSLEIIHRHANRPILGFWDFYLNHGIVGGNITQGIDQGKQAAAIALSILQGESVRNIPVVVEGPSQVVLDYAELSRFNWDKTNIPDGAVILNQPDTLYQRYKTLIYSVALSFTALLLLVIYQSYRIRNQNKTQKQLSLQVETDGLTGVKSRSFLIRYLNRKISGDNGRLTLFYFDIDNLKFVNDTFGHHEGDKYIQLAAEAISRHIRHDDVLARVGGDEFVCVINGSDGPLTNKLARDINSYLLDEKTRRELAYLPCLSCGSSTVDINSTKTAEAIIRAADAKMYQHKKLKKKKRSDSSTQLET